MNTIIKEVNGVSVVKLENARVEYASLNKVDKFNKYTINVAFESLTPEAQELFASVAFTNSKGEKMLGISSFKQLPETHVIIEAENKKFISKNDLCDIVVLLNQATNGKTYPEQVLVKYNETVAPQTITNDYGILTDKSALDQLLNL